MYIYIYVETFAHLISKSSILRFVYIGICGDVLSVVFPREYIPSGNSQLFQTRVFNVEDLPYIYICLSLFGTYIFSESQNISWINVYIYIC